LWLALARLTRGEVIEGGADLADPACADGRLKDRPQLANIGDALDSGAESPDSSPPR
jgi:hypothetical protein